MSFSARKPYLKLKKSITQFFKSRAVFIKQLNQKFSEFEKPYYEIEYPSMHLSIPEPDWPSYDPIAYPIFRPTPYPGFYPGYRPGPHPFMPGLDQKFVGPFERPESDWLFLGCEMYIFPTEVEPGGSYTIKFARGDDPIVDIDVEGPGTLTSYSLPECTGDAGGLCTVYLYVHENTGDWDWITITPKTQSGRTCGRLALLIGCSDSAAIGYTTLQMEVSEEQTLEAHVDGVLHSDTSYGWEITAGGGSLSASSGNSVTYTAPASNAECSNNPTIALSCDGVVVDSISIAVNDWDTDTDIAYQLQQAECYWNEPSGWCCTGAGPPEEHPCCCHYNYNCKNEHISTAGGWYGGDETYCDKFCSTPTVSDKRTQAMKDGGCCAEGLL